MNKKLSSCKVAILMADGFEEIEYTSPRKALEEEGAEVTVVSIEGGKVKAWDTDKWSESYPVDKTLTDIDNQTFDALMLPGGVINPDTLRKNTDAVEFVTAFFDNNRPVAAICHGPQLLIETKRINGRKLTSYPSIQTDLKNAGADWQDSEVVVDGGLVTSRKPDDLKAFNAKMIEVFSSEVLSAA